MFAGTDTTPERALADAFVNGEFGAQLAFEVDASGCVAVWPQLLEQAYFEAFKPIDPSPQAALKDILNTETAQAPVATANPTLWIGNTEVVFSTGIANDPNGVWP